MDEQAQDYLNRLANLLSGLRANVTYVRVEGKITMNQRVCKKRSPGVPYSNSRFWSPAWL
jgi:hypothetical protein